MLSGLECCSSVVGSCSEELIGWDEGEERRRQGERNGYKEGGVMKTVRWTGCWYRDRARIRQQVWERMRARMCGGGGGGGGAKCACRSACDCLC